MASCQTSESIIGTLVSFPAAVMSHADGEQDGGDCTSLPFLSVATVWFNLWF